MYDLLNENVAQELVDVVRTAIASNMTQRYNYLSSPFALPFAPKSIIHLKRQWFEAQVYPLDKTYDGERAVIWVARNVTESFQKQEQLRVLSEQDELTNLDNRRAFFKKAKQCFACLKRYRAVSSVLMIDIDHFKQVNDTKGHLFGDEVIKQVAAILKMSARDIDNVARLGGEEFSIILKLMDKDDACEIAELLRKKVASHVFKLDDITTNITISIGVSDFRASDTDYKDVFKRADDALYLAKRLGRNQVGSTN